MQKVVVLLIAFVAVVLAQSAVNKNAYKDVGFGECALDAAGGRVTDQKTIRSVFSTNDCENQCNSNARCKGYAFSDDGGWRICIVYFQGPLYPQKYQMKQKGNARCNIKKSAHPTTGIYAPDYVAVPDFRDIGFGECALNAAGRSVTDKQLVKTYRKDECEIACFNNPRCKGYSFSDAGGWEKCYVYFQGPLYPQKYSIHQLGNARCNIKISAHPTTGIYAPGYKAVSDYLDVGMGECMLNAKATIPVTTKHKVGPSGIRKDDCEIDCNNDSKCTGYTFNDAGGWKYCVRYFQGPLYPQEYESKKFGNGRCNIKKSAHPTTGIYDPKYKPAPKYQKLGVPGLCSLAPPNNNLAAIPSRATGSTMPAQTTEITNLATQNNCQEQCDALPSCRGFSWYSNGGWRGCFIHRLPVAAPTTQANAVKWATYECNQKLNSGLLELEENIEVEEDVESDDE